MLAPKYIRAVNAAAHKLPDDGDGFVKCASMSDIPEVLLDALMRLPAVQSLWLLPNQRRGSHFSRADEDLLIYAPALDDALWQQVMALVEKHEKWHLITVTRVEQLPVAGAKRVRG